MEKKSSAASKAPRLPEESHGIQVNFCKLPTCGNYGKADDTTRAKRGRHKAGDRKVRYSIIGEKKPNSKTPYAECSLCKEQFPLKSNAAIYEEITRLSDYLTPAPQAACPNSKCPNHSVGIKGRDDIQNPLQLLPTRGRWAKACGAHGSGKSRRGR
jgi:hypothetical protein